MAETHLSLLFKAYRSTEAEQMVWPLILIYYLNRTAQNIIHKIITHFKTSHYFANYNSNAQQTPNVRHNVVDSETTLTMCCGLC